MSGFCSSEGGGGRGIKWVSLVLLRGSIPGLSFSIYGKGGFLNRPFEKEK